MVNIPIKHTYLEFKQFIYRLNLRYGPNISNEIFTREFMKSFNVFTNQAVSEYKKLFTTLGLAMFRGLRVQLLDNDEEFERIQEEKQNDIKKEIEKETEILEAKPELEEDK